MRVLMVAVLALGCANDKDLMDEYRPRLDAIVHKLAQLKPMLDSAELEPIKSRPEPPFKLQQYGNAILIDFEHLTRPDTGVTSTWASDLTMALSWAKDTRKRSTTGETARSMRNVLDAAVGIRYVVAVRYLDFVEPKLIDKTTFEPGWQAARVYLVDLETTKLLGGFEVKATTPDEIRYHYREGESKEGAANRALEDALRPDLQKQVEAGLSWLGTVDLR